MQDVVQFEVGFELRFIEGVARLPDFFGIKGPVPGGELEAALLLVDELLHVGRFLARVRDRRRRELASNLLTVATSCAVWSSSW